MSRLIACARYWGPYCAADSGIGFKMCHKGHGYGKMHGPHMQSEWFIGQAQQSGAEELAGWCTMLMLSRFYRAHLLT